ncbi:MAG: bifunctional DNA-formamidopyrimidine glycosylase/DNA-(apurinic or apyrimidinic site) lyase [Candidatus Margulisiibacteriota bacterium]
MPELPEVETVRRGLSSVLPGKKIIGFESDWAKAHNRPVADYCRVLKGKKLLKVDRRGRLLILEAEGGWSLLVHLKMTGQLVFRDHRHCLIGGHPIEQSCQSLPNKFTHAIISFSDQSRLFFNDVRKFGWVRLYNAAERVKTIERMNLGPEPLSREFSLDYFKSMVAKRPRSKVKVFLMDNKVVVGVGNIYSDEVLFRARVMPSRMVGSLRVKEVELLHDGIKKILTAAIKAQGTTFSNYVNSNGEAGAYTKKLKVYGRYGEKCFKCKGEVARLKIGGRTSSFCPSCQR